MGVILISADVLVGWVTIAPARMFDGLNNDVRDLEQMGWRIGAEAKKRYRS
jgi:hypothetical protein